MWLCLRRRRRTSTAPVEQISTAGKPDVLAAVAPPPRGGVRKVAVAAGSSAGGGWDRRSGSGLVDVRQQLHCTSCRHFSPEPISPQCRHRVGLRSSSDPGSLGLAAFCHGPARRGRVDGASCRNEIAAMPAMSIRRIHRAPPAASSPRCTAVLISIAGDRDADPTGGRVTAASRPVCAKVGQHLVAVLERGGVLGTKEVRLLGQLIDAARQPSAVDVVEQRDLAGTFGEPVGERQVAGQEAVEVARGNPFKIFGRGLVVGGSSSIWGASESGNVDAAAGHGRWTSDVPRVGMGTLLVGAGGVFQTLPAFFAARFFRGQSHRRHSRRVRTSARSPRVISASVQVMPLPSVPA